MNQATFYANLAIVFIITACSTYVLVGNTAASVIDGPVGTVQVVHEEVEIEYLPEVEVTIIEEEVEVIYVPAS